MPTLIIKSNASQGTDVLIPDVGVEIPSSGGSDTFTENDEIKEFQRSEDLRTLVADDAFGAGSSTLILNDGTSDIDQDDAINFLDTIVLPDQSDANGFTVIQTNEDNQVEDDVTFDGTATITGLPLPTADSDVATKEYVDNIDAQDRIWKELILTVDQLDSTNDAVSQAIPFYLDAVAVATDTLVISDGSTTETFTFVASESVAFDVAVGASATDSMTNLAQAINDDSTLWSATFIDSLESINSSTGEVVAIYRTNQALASYDDRIFSSGANTNSADWNYISYNGELDYNKSTTATLPTADTTQKDFGFGRITSALVNNETHTARDTDLSYTWDSDDGVWQVTTTGGTVSASNVTISGTYTHIGSPTNAEDAFSNINDNFNDGAYIGKILQFSSTQRIPGNGTRYMKGPDKVSTSAAGVIIPRAGDITAITIAVDQADATNDYNIVVETGPVSAPTTIATLALTSTNRTASTTSPAGSLAFIAGDEILVKMERTSGSGGSDFREVQILIEYRDND